MPLGWQIVNRRGKTSKLDWSQPRWARGSHCTLPVVRRAVLARQTDRQTWTAAGSYGCIQASATNTSGDMNGCTTTSIAQRTSSHGNQRAELRQLGQTNWKQVYYLKPGGWNFCQHQKNTRLQLQRENEVRSGRVSYKAFVGGASGLKVNTRQMLHNLGIEVDNSSQLLILHILQENVILDCGVLHHDGCNSRIF